MKKIINLLIIFSILTTSVFANPIWTIKEKYVTEQEKAYSIILLLENGKGDRKVISEFLTLGIGNTYIKFCVGDKVEFRYSSEGEHLIRIKKELNNG